MAPVIPDKPSLLSQLRPAGFARFYPLLTLVVVVYCWLGGFTDGFIGHPYGDMPDHVWGNEWFAQELRQGRWPSWVKDNHFPTGGVLWHIDPLGGIFRRVFLFLPPHWIWNFYIFVLVFGFAWTVPMVSSIRYYRSVRSSLVYWRMNPYMAGLIHSGLTEYMTCLGYSCHGLQMRSGPKLDCG